MSALKHAEHIKARSVLWDQYVKEADAFDHDVVQGLSGDLDALLIFAGLFSAINTAFIIESYKDLKPDPIDAATQLLRTIAYTLDNSTMNPEELKQKDFVAPHNAVIVNSLYFASLSCSLFAAFGAVLAKQWLNEYRRTGKRHRSSYDRAHRRHIKYLGMEKYHSELVVQALGTVLQFSLFFFLVGVIEWLWPINRAVAYVVTAGTGLIFIFYLATTIISIFDYTSPFSTRVSATLRSLWPALRHPEDFNSFQDGQCTAWLLENATTFETISAVANSVALLPAADRPQHGLEIREIAPIVLQSIISDDTIPTSFSEGSLHRTLRTLSAVLPESNQSPHFPMVIEELGSVLRFVASRDESLSGTIVRLLDVTARGHIPAPGLARDVMINYIGVPSLSRANLQAGLSLLYRHFIRPSPVESLRREYELAIEKGMPAQETWQWDVAEALETTTKLDDDSRDKDALRYEFRQKWALIFLGTGSKFGVRPCPLWTMDYIRDNVGRSKEPADGPAELGQYSVVGSQTGLLVLLQYVWECVSRQREHPDSLDGGPGMAPGVADLCTDISSDMAEVVMLAIKEGSDWSGDFRLSLAPLLWLGSQRAYYRALARYDAPDMRPSGQYAQRLWKTFVQSLDEGWMGSKSAEAYVEGIETYLATADLTALDQNTNSSNYCADYLEILRTGTSKRGTHALPGDYELIERLESCIDTLAGGFGVDVERTKVAYVSDRDFDVDGEAFALGA